MINDAPHPCRVFFVIQCDLDAKKKNNQIYIWRFLENHVLDISSQTDESMSGRRERNSSYITTDSIGFTKEKISCCSIHQRRDDRQVTRKEYIIHREENKKNKKISRARCIYIFQHRHRVKEHALYVMWSREEEEENIFTNPMKMILFIRSSLVFKYEMIEVDIGQERIQSWKR